MLEKKIKVVINDNLNYKRMYYFYVTIQYYFRDSAVIFSTVITSMEYPTRIEIIENAFIEECNEHAYLGMNGIYDMMHDKRTKIISYSTLTKKQYDNYKLEKVINA